MKNRKNNVGEKSLVGKSPASQSCVGLPSDDQLNDHPTSIKSSGNPLKKHLLLNLNFRGGEP